MENPGQLVRFVHLVQLESVQKHPDTHRHTNTHIRPFSTSTSQLPGRLESDPINRV